MFLPWVEQLSKNHNVQADDQSKSLIMAVGTRHLAHNMTSNTCHTADEVLHTSIEIQLPRQLGLVSTSRAI
jgi:hypothetical protein